MSSSIEAEVDAFLSGPSRRVDKILSPSPRPKLDDKNAFDICKALVNRRAWREVITYTEDILKNNSADRGGYANLYTSLVNSAASSSDATTTTTTNAIGSEELAQIQKDTVHMIQWRLTGLLKLKRYRDLEIEVIKLGLLPSGVNKTTKKSPDWIPYGLEIAAAQSLLYTGTAQSCIDALYSMRTKLSPPPSSSSFTKTAKEDKNKIWINRINAALSNTFMRKKEWRLALSALDDLLHDIDHSVDVELETTLDSNLTPNNNNQQLKSVLKDVLCHASRIEVYSRQGRILLQVGALPEAELRFEKARTELVLLDSSLTKCDVSAGGYHGNATVNAYLKSLLVRQAKTNVTVNDGLYMFANEQYAPAMDKFDSAVQSQRQIDQDDERATTTTNTNTPNLLLDTSNNGSSIIHCFDENKSSLLSQSLNNMALCALYSCQMIKAVTLIESLIREDPTKYLTETLAFNLCTLYELGSDNEKSGKKKKVLKAVAERFSLHDVGSESFRIT